ncbi:hypothetical protein D9757_011469 [Collybiopsis confluens]|uniref:Inosine/uridine-preferring nucleoside hydrolase domain-containing protein n=1 Tax=Collybiopsis confluens TaxID=2823264 RepID=A0A8H5GJP7_9AGAR|nr:hypothetical protein D9757_015014 [Collybiopsis confluens]KAF5366349.1 hypothetical protein D9757_011469 [Collybiopsis confluens]
MSSERIPVWLDVDPGHDDAIAIMLAIHLPNIQLLGISTTHGNSSAYHTTRNAARCLLAFGGSKLGIRVYPGASEPLILPARYALNIHGPDGHGGVESLPEADDPAVLELIAKDKYGETIRALDGMLSHVKQTWKKGAGKKVTVVSCGPMTNIALFISVYPELLDAIEQFVFMGGAVGLGNKSAVAEFNILCGPHAAQIVLDAPVPAVMIPLNVTHQATVTRDIHIKLLSGSKQASDISDEHLPSAQTPLRHTLSTLISFFAETYKSVFGFDAPPLHDALAVAYVALGKDVFPEAQSRRYRVDVELTGQHTLGETVVDVWGYRNECSDSSWGSEGKNCVVVLGLDVDKGLQRPA